MCVYIKKSSKQTDIKCGTMLMELRIHRESFCTAAVLQLLKGNLQKVEMTRPQREIKYSFGLWVFFFFLNLYD